MAILRHFCCCFHVRGGSVFSGVYSLVTSAIFICVLVIRYVGFRILDTSSVDYSLPVYVTLCLFALKLITAVLLIVGVAIDNKLIIIPWIIVCIVCIFEGAGVMCWFLVRDMRLLGDIPPWEAGITTFHLCNSIILVYCLLCVISQLQDLVAGKGTAQDYRRRRQRRRRRQQRGRGLANAYIHNTYIPDIDFEDPFPSPEPPGRGPIVTPPPYTADKPPPYQTISNHAQRVIPTISQRCENRDNVTHQTTTHSLYDMTPPQPGTSGISALIIRADTSTHNSDHYIRRSNASQSGVRNDSFIEENCAAINFNKEGDDNSVCNNEQQKHNSGTNSTLDMLSNNNEHLGSSSRGYSLSSHIRYFEELNTQSNHEQIQENNHNVPSRKLVIRETTNEESKEETKL